MATTPEFEIISSLTRPDASAKDAIQKLLVLTATASKKIPNDDGSGALSIHIHNVWSALVDDVVANTDSAQQGELVEFVRELRLQKMINPATNSQLLYNLVADQYIPLWTGLPLFGISVRDEWNFDANSYTSGEEVCYYNKLTFLAKLTNTPENNVSYAKLELPPYDFSLYALWDFRAIFEEELISEAARRILFRAASLWMIHCAEKLWANVQAGRSFVHHASGTNPAFAGQKFDNEHHTWTGFNQNRWEIWVRGFGQADEAEDRDVRELIGKALIEIARVERAA